MGLTILVGLFFVEAGARFSDKPTGADEIINYLYRCFQG